MGLSPGETGVALNHTCPACTVVTYVYMQSLSLVPDPKDLSPRNFPNDRSVFYYTLITPELVLMRLLVAGSL